MALPGKPSFHELEHEYFIGKWQVPGTGDIMKVGGSLDDRWFNLSGRTRGQVIHHLTYQLDLRLVALEDIETEYQNWVIAYAAFLRKHAPDYTHLEQPVFNDELGFATVLDRAGRMPSERDFIINIKTGAKEDWHGVQRAGEVLAWRKKRDFDVVRYTLYLKKTGKFELFEHPFVGDFDEFEDCLIKWREQCHQPEKHGPKSLLKPLRSKRRLSAFRQRLGDSVASGSRRSGHSIPLRTRMVSAGSSSTTRSSTSPRSKPRSSGKGSKKR